MAIAPFPARAIAVPQLTMLEWSMPSRFDFANVPERTYDEWGDTLRSYPWGTPKGPEPKTFRTWWLDSGVYGFELAANKHRHYPGHVYSVRRDYEDLRADGVDDYHVRLQAGGASTVLQNDRVAALGPGEAVLFDAGRSSVLISDGGLYFDLALPRSRVMSHVGLDLQGGLLAPRGTAVSRALQQVIFDADESADLSGWARGQMQRVVFDLVGALFEPRFDPPAFPNAAFKRVSDIIRDSHADPDLTASKVAAEAGMSLCKLQALFTIRGTTCTAYIHLVRLEHAKSLMRRREFLDTNEQLSQISWLCGYRDHNYFARIFRRKFGQSPGAFAKSHRIRS
jgi:AraC family transcriptional regulator, positive regulator of tynA and feaB